MAKQTLQGSAADQAKQCDQRQNLSSRNSPPVQITCVSWACQNVSLPDLPIPGKPFLSKPDLLTFMANDDTVSDDHHSCIPFLIQKCVWGAAEVEKLPRYPTIFEMSFLVPFQKDEDEHKQSHSTIFALAACYLCFGSTTPLFHRWLLKGHLRNALSHFPVGMLILFCSTIQESRKKVVSSLRSSFLHYLVTITLEPIFFLLIFTLCTTIGKIKI